MQALKVETCGTGFSMTGRKSEGARVIGLDKRQLLLRHRSGDGAAFPELVNLFRNEVYSYLVRSGIRQADRDDLFQEIFFAVHRFADKYNPKLSFEPWLFTIVVNLVRNYFRKLKTIKEDSADSVPDHADSSASLQQGAEARETAEWLEEELQVLPLEQREAILLSYVKDMTQDDVAKALNLPLNTIKTHLRRGRLTLLEKIKARNQIISEEAL